MNDDLSSTQLIDGPAGQIELQLQEVPEQNRVAVLCHPHSQYGGSMYDNVVAALADVCLEQGVNVIKFNFRSVGRSEGQFDDGAGEVMDVIAVIEWAKQRFPNAQVILGGYSFGAAMALVAAARIQQTLAQLVLVAPPIQMVESDDALSIPLKVIVGGRDTIVSVTAASQYFDSEQLVELPRADHFFLDEMEELQHHIREFIQS